MSLKLIKPRVKKPKAIKCNDPMKLVVVITGESAEALFAAGPKDLIEHFIPEGLKVKSSDIKKCWFEQRLEKTESGIVTKYLKHKDNLY